MFSILVGFSALVVASCAAFFSVQGLATLYAGQFLSVCIMAGGLEFGKLVTASYLHRYWNVTSFLLKTYLIIAVILLMGITSLGIFGFLTSAYQQNHNKVELVESKKSSIEINKNSLVSEMDLYKSRIEKLNEIRITQEKRVQESGNYKLPREQAYQAIKEANEEIVLSQDKIKTISDKINNLDQEILSLKIEESKSSDIGTLKFVASSFNITVESVVKWLTLLIVLVFDPLAISLILAYNNIVYKKENIATEETSENKISFKKIKNSLFNVKYKDK